jgi:hypothetical protein
MPATPLRAMSRDEVRDVDRRAIEEYGLPGVVPVRGSGTTSGRDWMGLRTTDDSILKSVSRTPLFAGFLGLALLLLALGSTWYREGR